MLRRDGLSDFLYPLFSEISVKTIIPIDTYKSTMVYGVSEQNKLLFLYFGKKLGSHADFSQQSFIAKPDTDRRFESIAVPTLGGDGFMGEPMLSVKHADGALSTELRYLSHNTDNKDKANAHTTAKLHSITIIIIGAIIIIVKTIIIRFMQHAHSNS